MKTEFENYISQHSRDLTRLCMSLCNNTADADDLFQDTWYKAMKNYKKYKKEMPFEHWLFSICVNTYKNDRKLFYNSKKVAFGSNEEKTKFLNSIPNTDDSNSDDYYELHTAVSKLPKKQKIVIILFYFKDYSIAQIATILKIPEGTVKSRLNMAKSKIKRRLCNEKK